MPVGCGEVGANVPFSLLFGPFCAGKVNFSRMHGHLAYSFWIHPQVLMQKTLLWCDLMPNAGFDVHRWIHFMRCQKHSIVIQMMESLDILLDLNLPFQEIVH